MVAVASADPWAARLGEWVALQQRRAAVAEVPWTPADLDGLAAWYDASTIDATNNQLLDAWADSSGNDRGGLSTGSLRPTYITDARNGKGVVRFDGAHRFDLTNSLSVTRNVGYVSLWGVAAVNTKAGETTRAIVSYIIGNNATRTRRNLGVAAAAGNYRYLTGGRRLDADGFQSITSENNISNTWVIAEAEAVYTAGTRRVRVNAVDEVTASGIQGTGNTSDTDSFVAPTIGTGSASLDQRWTGDMAEILTITLPLSTTDRQKLEGYLAHKWGLAANLPSNHPYKNSPPTK